VDINSRHLRYVLAVIEERSFVRAAAKIRVSQPAISRMVKGVEDAMGLQILERQSRETVATSAGERLAGTMRDLIECVDEMGAIIKEINGSDTPVLKIGVPIYVTDHGLSTLLSEYKSSLSSAHIETWTGYTLSLVEGIGKGDYDLLALTSPLPHNPSYEYIVLRWCPVRVAVPQALPLSTQAIITIDDLSNSTVATFQRDRQPHLFDEIFAPLEQRGIILAYPPDPWPLAMLSYAADHRYLVISCFDEYSEDDARNLGMILRPLEDIPPPVALLLMRRAGENRPQCDRFWQFAKDWVSKHPYD
jgi:DNA-binding transcriptional LysR family regulator